MSGRKRIIMVLIAGLLHGVPAGAAAQELGATRSGTPAAKVGEEFISNDEVEQSLRPQLARLERQRYELLSQTLEQRIEERLLAQEARRRGITVERLLQLEVYPNTPEVTDPEVIAFLKANSGNLRKGDEAQLPARIKDYLSRQRVNEQRAAYVRRLRRQTRVVVYLKEPAAVRVNVREDRGFAQGSVGAPVTIVEFTDFQCPFCRATVQTVKRLIEAYPGKIRWIVRDFPLSALHPAAAKAHEAARCAAEQGRFWQYHDLIFDRAPNLSPDELKQYAAELHLDAPTFATCLDSAKYQAGVASDVEEGTRLGVSATPTFFINGRMQEGAQPFVVFQRVIESELAHDGQR